MKCSDCRFLCEPTVLVPGDYRSVRCTKGLWDNKDREPPIPVWYAWGSAVRNRGPVHRYGEACTVGEPKDQGASIRPQVNEPFAVLRVPDDVLAELVNNPTVIDDLKRLIGVKVLIIGDRVDLLMGRLAEFEVDRLHKEIHKFLNEPKGG